MTEIVRRPATFVRVVIGGDLSYSSAVGSDQAALLPLGEDDYGDVYVLDCDTMQQSIVIVEGAAKRMQESYASLNGGELPPIVSYMSGPEKGVAELLAMRGLQIHMMPARWNKFVRAQKTAVAWSQGRIKVPRGAPWVPSFLRKVRYFTGMEDQADDEVDAMVSGFDFLAGNSMGVLGMDFMHGQRRM